MAGTFKALEKALELGTMVGELVPAIRRHNSSLADQMARAAVSIPSCLAEGAQRIGKDRINLYRTASGSAAELKVQLQLAERWRVADADLARRASALADELSAMTWRLSHPKPRAEE